MACFSLMNIRATDLEILGGIRPYGVQSVQRQSRSFFNLSVGESTFLARAGVKGE
jgi:hypothetical protein